MGCLTLDDYGTTWDEPQSYRLGGQNVALAGRALSGGEIEPWPPQRIPGYQFGFDLARALVAEAANALFFEPHSAMGFRFFNLLLASGSLWLLYRLAWAVTNDRRTAALALLVLAALPKFLAHSQNNPKDGIGLFCFLLALLLVVRAARRPLAASVVAGLAVGLALSSHVVTTAVAPIAAAWLLYRGEGPGRRRLLRIAVVGAVAAPAAVVFQPWLLMDPWERLPWIVENLANFEARATTVLYLGELFPGADPPWHYSLVLLLVSTPLLLLACAAAGAGKLRDPQSGPLVRLALVWLATLLIADGFASARYDGVRHLLPALPAIALLAAVGLRTIWDASTRAHPALRAAVAMALAAGALTWAGDLARMHPYHDAYLNAAARLAAGDPPERWMELEIWGASYKEGAAWLAEHAEPGATVVVPIAPHCARPYLENVVKQVPSERGDAPVYLMFMTRVAKYKDVIRRAEERLEPVFTIRRGDATLLAIYRLDEAWDG